MSENTPPVCDYEGSDYQQSFWGQGSRAYEDAVEALALRRLLPLGGKFMLELGAGAGRNTKRYKNFQRIALLDYSRSQLVQAQAHLGSSERYLYVAADVYRLPFVDGLFDAATMIRTLHHMAEPALALSQVHRVMVRDGVFILEFANKRNLKAILRFFLGKQTWNPFTFEPIEFAALNFNFHPKAVWRDLKAIGFIVERVLSVSHCRVGLVKRLIPLQILVGLDALLQWTGRLVQFSPSVFVRAHATGKQHSAEMDAIFQCPRCQTPLPGFGHDLLCGGCSSRWPFKEGIYDFRVRAEQ